MAYMGFSKLKGELASRSGVRSPGGLATFIGRKKYGSKAMAEHARKKHSFRDAVRSKWKD